MNSNTFAEILKTAREKKGISQIELAKMTGLTVRSIIYWEQGKANITLKNADKLLKALGVVITIGDDDINVIQ